MTGVLLGMLVLGVVAATGLLVAAMLGLRSVPELVLASYVAAYGEIVGLTLLLSVFGTFTRAALVGGTVAVLAGTIGARLLVDAPRPQLAALAGIRSLFRVHVVRVLAGIVALTFAYVLALVLGTPPNGWDQLNYHLARAALWIQAEHVGYVDAAYDQRINAYPPNGEISVAFVLDVTRNEIFAATVQLTAALACAVGVFALARGIGLARHEAAFGALLFLALPIVVLQASSTKNDVVVASLLVAAAAFVLGDSRRKLGLASLATALAVGSKFTAFYGVLFLLALALVATGPPRRLERVVAIGIGAAVGLYWYAVNLAESGMLLGDTSGIPGLTSGLKPPENLLAAFGLAFDWIDLSGAQGADLLLYLVAAVLVAIGAATLTTGSRADRARYAIVAGTLVAAPVALYQLAAHVGRPALVRLHDALGEPQSYIPPSDDPNASPALASDTGSWFGPVGLLLAVGIGIAAVILVRRGVLPRSAAVCAVAPLLWTVLVALSLTYHPWQGRFFLFPVALSASLWGLTVRAPPAAWGVTALSGVTALLALVHYMEKPSGLRLLEREHVTSVWQLERWEIQSQHDPAITSVFEFLDVEVPRRDSLALALGVNDFGYPAFGPRLERSVQLVPFGSSDAEIAVDWLYANPERAAEIDRTCWTEAFRSESGTVFRRQAESCRA